MKCPKCGNEAQADAIFCDQCGTRLAQPAVAAPAGSPVPAAQPAAPVTPAPAAPVQAAAGIICPACKASNTPGEMFCSECGAKLAAPQPEAAAVTQSQTVAATPAPAAKPGALACPACGANVAIGDEYCFACGAEVKGAVAAPAAHAAAPVAPPAATAAEAVPAASLPATECPACGAAVKPGDTFCEFCGAALVLPDGTSAKSAASQTAKDAVVRPAGAPTQTSGGPFLVVVGSGVEIPLPTDREVIVGREDPYSGVFPDVDLTPHGGEQGGVSRRHLKIRLVGGQFMIEDLNSTNFTLLNRVQVKPGAPLPLSNGDEISAGRVKLIFKVR